MEQWDSFIAFKRLCVAVSRSAADERACSVRRRRSVIVVSSFDSRVVVLSWLHARIVEQSLLTDRCDDIFFVVSMSAVRLDSREVPSALMLLSKLAMQLVSV